MPDFRPFAALRYDPARFAPEDVTAPPYDVLSPADRTALVARNPHNAVLVDLPVPEDGDDRYAAAGDRLAAWEGEGVLVRDAAPTFTAYRMTTTDDLGRPVATLGVLGSLALSRPGEGEILPLLDDEDAAVRQGAIQALGAVGGPRALVQLLKLAKREGAPAGERAAALDAVAKISARAPAGATSTQARSPAAAEAGSGGGK